MQSRNLGTETESTAEIRVIMFGLGRVGRDVTRLLSVRPDFRIVSAYSRNAALAGRDLGEHAGIERLGLSITTDRAEALGASADIAVIATTSFLRDLADDIRTSVEAFHNVIVTGEEMFFPWIVNRPIAESLDRLARQHKVTILGAGANPGFIFDALVLTAAGATWDVQRIKGRRVVDCSHFSLTILRRLGFGYNREEFESGVRTEKVYGHIGFPQSIQLVAACLGLKVDRIEKCMNPLIAERRYVMDHLEVLPGQTVGFIQEVTGVVDGEPWYQAEFIGHADPIEAGFEVMDSIQIEGFAPIHISIKPGCNPHLTAAGIIANSLRRVVCGPPGLITIADLPPAFPPRTPRNRLKNLPIQGLL